VSFLLIGGKRFVVIALRSHKHFFNIILETRALRYLNTIAIAVIRNFATNWLFILLIMTF